jgi:aminopeptidase
MAEPRIERLATTLVNYSARVQPGDHVAIYSAPDAAALVRAVYREVLRAGGHPYTFIGLPGLSEIFFEEANADQLTHVSRVDQMVRGEFDALIGISAESNTRSLSNISPEKQAERSRALTDLMEVFMKRSASGEFKWVSTLFPTNAYAQDAEMSLSDFEDFVYGACFADHDDPVAKWQEIHDVQQKLVDWLKGKKAVQVTGPNIDLKLSIEGRTFINSDGTHNMPSGEIFTGPVEESVEGWVRFTYPAVTRGRAVEGVELTFEKGRVVKATAEKNEAFLLSMLDADEGARTLGEFAVGTNSGIDRFVKNILFDEKIGGTIHMAVGAGYPETGSQNQSAIHWDFICDMREGGEITVDGELFYRSGEFMV